MATNANRQHERTPANDDVITDPALDDHVGTDWTDEGGATPSGPATSTLDSVETEQSRSHDRLESELVDEAVDRADPATRPSRGDH